jgi:hypothetical protein
MSGHKLSEELRQEADNFRLYQSYGTAPLLQACHFDTWADRAAALEQLLAEAEVNAARYEALCGLSCEVAQKDNPAGVVAVLWHVPKFLRTKTDLQLNALADALLAEGTAPPEGSAT